MKVLVDCRYVRIGHPDGISRHTTGLVHALADLHPIEMLVSDRRQLAHLPDRPWHLINAPTDLRELLVARRLRRLDADVVFSPMQTMGSWGRHHRLVLTLHDLIYYRHRTPPPEFRAPLRLLWRLFHLAWWPQRLLLDRADAVVTVSTTTADLIARHRLTRRPVTVIPNAADLLAGCAPADRERLPRQRVLVYMGSFMAYKNVATLARAMTALPEYELHLVSPVRDVERRGLVALSRGGRLVFHDGATDTAYRDVLRGATALVSASRDEGFGIPLVEAMSVGTPLVVSDIPVHREIGGHAAAYLNADDVTGFVGAVRALEDPDTWSRRSHAARARASAFTWQASAHRLLALLEQVTGARYQQTGDTTRVADADHRPNSR